MIEGLALAEPLSMIDSCYNGCIFVYKDPLVLVSHESGRVGKILVVEQKLALVHENAIIVCADEGISYQSFQRLRIVTQLCLVPGILQCDQQTDAPM